MSAWAIATMTRSFLPFLTTRIKLKLNWRGSEHKFIGVDRIPTIALGRGFHPSPDRHGPDVCSDDGDKLLIAQ